MRTHHPLKIDGLYQIVTSRDGKNVGRKIRVVVQLPDVSHPRHLVVVEGIFLDGAWVGERELFDGVSLRALPPPTPVCRCSAYEWPHHRAKGKCFAKEGPPYCVDCNHHAEPLKMTSHGGLDTFEYYYSKCCGVAIYHDAELTMQAFPPDLEELS
jgi:hypothetical protein